MQRNALLVEAYVPGLTSLSLGRLADLQCEISALLPRGQVALLIAIPDDETVLLIAWVDDDPGALPDVSLLGDSVSDSRLGAVVQRIVHARLIATASTVTRWPKHR